MKKVLLLAILALGAGIAFGQDKLKFGISAGIGSSSILNSLTYGPGLAVRGAILTEYPITKNISVGLTPSFNYYSTKYSGELSLPGGSSFERTNINRFYSLSVPVYFKIKPAKGLIKPYYSFGSGPSFLLGYKNIESFFGNDNPKVYDVFVNRGYENFYWTINNTIGAELSGKKISPFIEFIALHSVSKVNEFSQYGNLNTYTINLGFKF